MTSSRFGCSDGFSLAGRMSDRRNQSRLRRARVVQVLHDGEAAHARCRDFSDVGMKLDLTSPLDINDTVTVALSPTIALCGHVAWVNGRECGVVFDSAVDSTALLEAAESEQGGESRPDTLTLLAANRALARRRETAAPVRPHFEPGLAVTVIAPDHEQRGIVRWAKGNIAALELEGATTEMAVELPTPSPLRLPPPR